MEKHFSVKRGPFSISMRPMHTESSAYWGGGQPSNKAVRTVQVTGRSVLVEAREWLVCRPCGEPAALLFPSLAKKDTFPGVGDGRHCVCRAQVRRVRGLRGSAITAKGQLGSVQEKAQLGSRQMGRDGDASCPVLGFWGLQPTPPPRSLFLFFFQDPRGPPSPKGPINGQSRVEQGRKLKRRKKTFLSFWVGGTTQNARNQFIPECRPVFSRTRPFFRPFFLWGFFLLDIKPPLPN